MKKPKLHVTILKENVGYSATIVSKNKFIASEAETFELLLTNLVEAINLTFEESGFTYQVNELKFTYDLESFFEFYKVINAKALSERIGMNQSLLAQYIKGIKKPSTAQIRRILTGVQQIGKELAEVQLLL
ncbi:MAG: XRE family transcriptional regulator [Bacteroidetes bacterium]|nr:XRE family transcriptional regulator [Bacteroidota bacterium]